MSTHALRKIEALHLQKIGRRIDEIGGYVWTDRRPVKDVQAAETEKHLAPEEAACLRYRPMQDGWRWGKPWSTAWFRLRCEIPKAFRGEPVSLLFEPDGECLVFRNGEPVQGLDRNRKDLPLTETARGGERIELYVEAGANSAFGKFEVRTARAPEIAVFRPEVWQTWMDLRALYDMVKPLPRQGGYQVGMRNLPEDDTRRGRIVYALNKAVDRFDYRDVSPEALRASCRRVAKVLAGVLRPPAHASAQTLACLGHAHIDVAWLWPLRETVRKCGRTFSNVLALMDRYPEFVFCQSQPQLYDYTRTRYPSLYKKIRDKVASGQWVPTGCMWVEADCNLVSGESLVRQVLEGTRFFEREFGVTPACLWLPDVFGYSAALPQILRRSGYDYFLTQKISWNQFTVFPHHTFRWEGIDGSRVLSHFPPVETYNATLDAPQVLGAAANYRQKDRAELQAVPFGYGDGGGGPTAEMLERIRCYADLEGVPKLRPMTPRAFFEQLEATSEDLPVWVGELYLELHRGTLTTQARNKRHNRRAEFLLRETEMLAALAHAGGTAYPAGALGEAWRTVLLHQFHDIIPGSSIGEVYEDSERDYAEVFRAVEALRGGALGALAEEVDTAGDGTPLLVTNSLGWERRAVIETDAKSLRKDRAWVAVDPEGEAAPVQVGHDGQARFAGTLPSCGHAVFHLRPADSDAGERGVSADAKGMESDRLRLRFDGKGRLRSVYDKANRREAIAPGATGNQLQLFEDKPVNYDAWDVDVFYRDKPLETDGELVSIEALEEGSVRGVVRVVRRISRSTVTQEIVLEAGSPRVDFRTVVEWGDERDVLLKVAFPVDVRSETARYEIQFGHLERPTHANTPADLARFEVVGHKWADLAEPDYGVALLNDCKYGYDVRGNVLRLSLLRAPKVPDPEADVKQTHAFAYALLPHAGDGLGEVIREGYALNAPPSVLPAEAHEGELPARRSVFSISGENVILETVKKAEADDALILRLYEAHGCRGRRTLRTSLPVETVIETDLLEREEKALTLRNGSVRLDFKPFQIRTLKLVLASSGTKASGGGTSRKKKPKRKTR